MQFSSRLLLWQEIFPFIFPAIYILVLGGRYRADLFPYFQMKRSRLFLKILPFGFCAVNSESDAYLPVDTV